MTDFSVISAENETDSLIQVTLAELLDSHNEENIFMDRNMTREQYIAANRANRIAANEAAIARNFDNSAIWNLRDQIAAETSKTVGKLRAAWAGVPWNDAADAAAADNAAKAV